MANTTSCHQLPTLSPFFWFKLEKDLTEAGNKLLNFQSLSSAADISTILLLTEHTLSKVRQSPPKSLIKPLNQIINALIAKEYVRHPDMDVNISVACCICEILRITKSPYTNEQIKDFFELVVMSFEKLSSAGGYYRMSKVLEVFSTARLPILMLDLKQDGHGLIVRLFKHFLNVSDSNSTAIVLNMEKIMTMLIDESEELAIELQALILASMTKDNQSASPVCWQFGEKVLMICAAKLKPVDRMSIAVYDYPKMVAHICETASEMVYNETIPFTTERSNMIDKIKLEYPATVNMMRTLRHCRGTPMASESAPFLEHGEILMGRRIKVWRAEDEVYRPGVVKSFNCIYKMHKVLLDDGVELNIDLKLKRWMFENLSAIPDSSLVQAGPAPREVSSPQSGIICVQGYKMENVYAPILETIFKKHGDIAAECVFTDSMRTSLLEVVCKIVRLIETNDVTNIISKMKEIKNQVTVAETAKIDVSWLRAHLEAIHKMNEAGKKVTMLVELKTNTILVKRAAQTDLNERHAKLVAAQISLKRPKGAWKYSILSKIR
ncbi:phospholipase-like protein [Artemisia annua]|uniref:Phospholipase-like protein n=1 Tax=Artemisia annua TaxID=35608 RepID=A0A2U1Q8P4_ARTAN|nr:phospholipase-like protein [Artemisia annua]